MDLCKPGKYRLLPSNVGESLLGKISSDTFLTQNLCPGARYVKAKPEGFTTNLSSSNLVLNDIQTLVRVKEVYHQGIVSGWSSIPLREEGLCSITTIPDKSRSTIKTAVEFLNRNILTNTISSPSLKGFLTS